ncbi:MAG: endonuclease/exonuclease/phosphatase family protein [Flavobacteriaceae bacterium]
MKLSFFENLLLFFNLLLLIFQLMLMGSIPSFFNFSILNLFVPVVVLINLLLFCYWVVKIKWPFLLFMGAFLIGYGEWNLLYQFPNNTIRKSGSTIGVMSYNVRLFNKYQWIKGLDVATEIEQLIREENPDVICFQEYSKTDTPRLDAYEYRYIQPNRSMGKSPLAIYSKLPILDQGYIDFEGSTNSGAYVDLFFSGKRFRVYNLHFESFRINEEDSLFTNPDSAALQIKFDEVFKKQLSQIEQFESVEATNDLPAIVCTDLNNTQFSKTYKAIAKGRQDTFAEAGKGLGETFYFSSFPLRIDFIFAHEEFNVNSFKVIPKKYSDHFPILTTLGWD